MGQKLVQIFLPEEAIADLDQRAEESAGSRSGVARAIIVQGLAGGFIDGTAGRKLAQALVEIQRLNDYIATLEDGPSVERVVTGFDPAFGESQTVETPIITRAKASVSTGAHKTFFKKDFLGGKPAKSGKRGEQASDDD